MFSNDRNVESIAQLVEVLKHYIGLQSEYVKLDVIEKVVRLITALAITLTVILFLLIILIYLSFALAYAIAPYVGTATAFCIVAGIYLLLFILILFKRKKWIEKPLVKFFAAILLNN